MNQLPKNVIAFLRSHVDHDVKLRFLLILYAAPGSSISVLAAARTLDVPRSQVRDMANELAADNLLRVLTDRLELAPTSIGDRLAIAELASWSARDESMILDVLRAFGRAS